jgi:uncharacterized protein
MSKEEILSRAEAFVKKELENDSSGHDWWHIYRVAKMARTIAVQEGADMFVCELAALLHDVADEKLNPSKEAGIQKVVAWMENNAVSKEDAAHVLEIISTMSYSGGQNPPVRTLEGKVVQDADRLDAIGAVGISRVFAYSGWKGQAIYDPNIAVRDNISKEAYRKEKSTAINHFYEKLLKLKDLMNTAYARQLAEERHQVMENFLQQFYLEWEAEK